MLIALEGIDGAGKSTVARELETQLRSAAIDARCVDKKLAGAVRPEIQARAAELRSLIWEADAPADPFGATHWILLLASWYSALDRIQPLFTENDGLIVIADGWYYRNIAKTIIRAEAEETWLESLFSSAAAPDRVVLLDVDPQVAWARAPALFSDTELGRWDGYEGPAEESFCTYQSCVREELLRMGRDRGWIHYAPIGDRPPGEVAAAIIERVLGDVQQERTSRGADGAAMERSA